MKKGIIIGAIGVLSALTIGCTSANTEVNSIKCNICGDDVLIKDVNTTEDGLNVDKDCLSKMDVKNIKKNNFKMSEETTELITDLVNDFIKITIDSEGNVE